jgi:hypothetical protein
MTTPIGMDVRPMEQIQTFTSEVLHKLQGSLPE